MSSITYYPDCGELFNIHLLGGISHYLIEKNVVKNKNIVNKAELAPKLESNNIREISYNGNIILLNSVYSILSKIVTVGNNFYNLNRNRVGKYNVIITHMVNTNAGSQNVHTFNNDGKLLVLSTLTVSEQMNKSTNYLSLFKSNNINECTNFISYVNTRLIRFLIMGSIVASSLRNEETWRFVPQPKAFDHIFTDEELYKQYNLTEEEINIIESVIKERK